MHPLESAETFHVKPDVSRGLSQLHSARAHLRLSEVHEQLTPAWYALIWHSAPFRESGALPTHQVVTGERVYVEVNEGRWTVRCPSEKSNCFGSEYASTSDRRFMCVSCLNAWVGGKWLRVVWPKNAEQIQRVLEMRDAANQQWWNHDESLEDLIKENEAHGIDTRRFLQ